MVEWKAFLENIKLQDHVSQYGVHDYSANNKKKGNYYKYPSLPHFRDNFNYKENSGKKSFFGKSKASISCIPRWRT